MLFEIEFPSNRAQFLEKDHVTRIEKLLYAVIGRIYIQKHIQFLFILIF